MLRLRLRLQANSRRIAALPMTNPHAELVQERRRQALAKLADRGITISEYAVLNHVHYGCYRRREALGKFAACPDYALGVDVSVRQTSSAVRALLQRGMLRVISKMDLTRIKRELAHEQTVGPIYGWPDPGMVDFTEAGATLWQTFVDWQQQDHPNCPR